MNKHTQLAKFQEADENNWDSWAQLGDEIQYLAKCLAMRLNFIHMQDVQLGQIMSAKYGIDLISLQNFPLHIALH